MWSLKIRCEMIKKNVVKTSSAEIWIDDQGICHLIYTPGARLTFEDTLNECRIISEMSGPGKVPILVDLNNVKYVSRESRTYYAGKEAEKIFKVAALLVGTQMSRVIGNFFMGLNKPLMPIKLFTSEKQALKWLKDFDG